MRLPSRDVSLLRKATSTITNAAEMRFFFYATSESTFRNKQTPNCVESRPFVSISSVFVGLNSTRSVCGGQHDDRCSTFPAGSKSSALTVCGSTFETKSFVLHVFLRLCQAVSMSSCDTNGNTTRCSPEYSPRTRRSDWRP